MKRQEIIDYLEKCIEKSCSDLSPSAALFRHRLRQAIDEIQLIRPLQNRCAALTDRSFCYACLMECEVRAARFEEGAK